MSFYHHYIKYFIRYRIPALTDGETSQGARDRAGKESARRGKDLASAAHRPRLYSYFFLLINLYLVFFYHILTKISTESLLGVACPDPHLF